MQKMNTKIQYVKGSRDHWRLKLCLWHEDKVVSLSDCQGPAKNVIMWSPKLGWKVQGTHIPDRQCWELIASPGQYLFWFLPHFFEIIRRQGCLGWCVSVDWALACEPKGCWFNSQSGHMPGLWARFCRGCERGSWSMYLWHIDASLPFSLPYPLSKNK